MPVATQPPRRRAVASGNGRSLTALLVGLVAVVLGMFAALATSEPTWAGPGQEDLSTTSSTATTTVTTTEDLLVGETTVPTTETTTSSTTVPGSGQAAADEDARTVWYIVAGLVFVAFCLAVLTTVYWRRTRPQLQVTMDDR